MRNENLKAFEVERVERVPTPPLVDCKTWASWVVGPAKFLQTLDDGSENSPRGKILVSEGIMYRSGCGCRRSLRTASQPWLLCDFIGSNFQG